MKTFLLASVLIFSSFRCFADVNSLEKCINDETEYSAQTKCVQSETKVQKSFLDQVYTETIMLMAKNSVNSNDLINNQNSWQKQHEEDCEKQIEKFRDEKGNQFSGDQKTYVVQSCIYISTMNQLNNMYVELGTQKNKSQKSL